VQASQLHPIMHSTPTQCLEQYSNCSNNKQSKSTLHMLSSILYTHGQKHALTTMCLL